MVSVTLSVNLKKIHWNYGKNNKEYIRYSLIFIMQVAIV